MKAFNNLVDEVRESLDLEELEAGADLFNYGCDKGYYSARQAKEFNTVYWDVKNQLIAESLKTDIKGIEYNALLYMITKAPTAIKENKEKLTEYIKGIQKNLKRSKVLV